MSEALAFIAANPGPFSVGAGLLMLGVTVWLITRESIRRQPLGESLEDRLESEARSAFGVEK